jgi:outer membrane protein W
MTKRFWILAAVLLSATPLFAQKAAISVFVANPGGGWSSDEGSTANGDLGVGAEYWFSPRVSAAVNVSRHQDDAVVFFDVNGFPMTSIQHVYEYPVDVLLRYRFAGNERWKPYLGGGLRAVHAFDAPFGVGRAWKVAPEINGGVTFLITKKLGLDFDARAVSNQTRYTGVDDTRLSIGLSWHF